MYTLTFTVTAAEADARLDAVVALRCPDSTKALIRRAIAASQIVVNDRAASKGDKLHTHDIVTVRQLLALADVRVAPDPAVEVEIVFVDSDLIAVNKPGGMACHPLHPDERGTVANGIAARFPETVEVGDLPLAAGVLHRIDGGTSGVVLVARSQSMFDAMRTQFRTRDVCKSYVALVEGTVTTPGRLEHRLAHQPSFRGRMVDAARLARPDRVMVAVTEYRPLQQIADRTLLEVTIFTGVTHQIRCQLALIGHPVVGDTRYGADAVTGFPRHFLHAQAVTFRHPRSGVVTTLRAPLTPDLQAFLDRGSH